MATGEITEDATDFDDVQADPVEALNPNDLFNDNYTPSFANGDQCLQVGHHLLTYQLLRELQQAQCHSRHSKNQCQHSGDQYRAKKANIVQ
ncbi:hypothetical protein RHMOL_Rhmol10G0196200 [Rhododendron molle]|uniref:Uncharacterized protein n=1 Tax=Rhododendron molle TaxID=49168 RepID=A0ACC0M475_RHOML|nr:hypothetical protein RHMOL_Rhmol10G0196200 [Rhododendron molle]